MDRVLVNSMLKGRFNCNPSNPVIDILIKANLDSTEFKWREV